MLSGSRAHCLYINKDNCAIYTYIFSIYQYFLQYVANECETKFIVYEWQMQLNVKDKWNCKLENGRSCEVEARPKEAALCKLYLKACVIKCLIMSCNVSTNIDLQATCVSRCYYYYYQYKRMYCQRNQKYK